MKYKELIDQTYDVMLFIIITVCLISAAVLIIIMVAKYIKTGLLLFETIYASGLLVILGIGLSVYFIKINSLKK